MPVLEIHAHRNVQYRLAAKECIHLPAGVKPEEISQQRTSCSKAITACKGTDTASSQLYIQRTGGNCRVLAWNGERRTGDILRTSIPCGANIEELYDLEVPQESIINGFVEERCKEWHAEFAVDDNGIVTIGHILFES